MSGHIEIIESMREVLKIEAEGILSMAEVMGENYVETIRMLQRCTGKIVLTGMGKSGHVAKKISATMSSLGISSVFLHPAEAAHGDLGVVQTQDIVIMLSKSGETEELIQLMPSLRVIGSRMIGIFCKHNSTLEKYCDKTLIIKVDREACANNLAPTTSTTMMMALGDALAVTISKMNSFSSEEFALFHPKGTLGKQLLTTAETLINQRLESVAVRGEVSVESILWTITENHLGAVAIVNEEGKLEGIVSDGDIRRGLKSRENLLQTSAREIMTKEPVYVKKSMLAMEVFYLMQRKKISVVPVVDDSLMVLGMISMHDIIQTGIVV